MNEKIVVDTNVVIDLYTWNDCIKIDKINNILDFKNDNNDDRQYRIQRARNAFLFFVYLSKHNIKTMILIDEVKRKMEDIVPPSYNDINKKYVKAMLFFNKIFPIQEFQEIPDELIVGNACDKFLIDCAKKNNAILITNEGSGKNKVKYLIKYANKQNIEYKNCNDFVDNLCFNDELNEGQEIHYIFTKIYNNIENEKQELKEIIRDYFIPYLELIFFGKWPNTNNYINFIDKKELTNNEKQISIIIPVFNNWIYTKNCLEKLFKLDNNYEIIIIDNGSTDETQLEIENFKKNMHNLIYIRNEKNLGFGGAINLVFRKIFEENNSKNSLILNNDIKFGSDDNVFKWLDTLSNILNKSKDIIIGPTGGFVDENNFSFLYETEMYNKNINYISGWCLAASNKTWKKLISANEFGPFDTKNFFVYFEDTDLGFRCKQKNIGFCLMPTPLIHIGKQTSKFLNISKLYLNSKTNFIKKWKKYDKNKKR